MKSKRSFFGLKRVVAVCLIISAVLVLVPSGIFATERSGIVIKDVSFKTKLGEIYSYPEGYYYTTQNLEYLPRTLEAWVLIPKNKINQNCGVIFGNYAEFENDVYINYEIAKDGVPRMVWSDNDRTKHDFYFRDAAIQPDVWTHVAFVYGGGSNGKSICCYINGELRQEYGEEKWSNIHNSFYENKFSLAGDLRALNSNHFRGELGDVVIYSDTRDAETIAQDMTAPNTDDRAMIAYYNLFEAESKQDVPDKSGNGYDMYYGKTWLSESEMQALRDTDEDQYAYSIAIVPDTQHTTCNFPHKLQYIYDWLIENAEEKNIQYVISVGDMTNNNTEGEWETVKTQTDRMNGIVPYTVLRGNHDSVTNGTTQFFDRYYAKKDGYYYGHVKENGGFFNEDSVKNTYLLFSVGSVNYMILNLDFGAGDDVLAWADSVLRQYPDHRVIVVTHAYLSSDGTTIAKGEFAAPSSYTSPEGIKFNDGEDMWNEVLRYHENIEMIVCGHVNSDSIVMTKTYGLNKNVVYQILIDGQNPDALLGSLGLVAMMYFTEDGNVAAIEYYSTVWDAYFKNGKSRIKLNFPSHESEILPEVPANTGKDGNKMNPWTIAVIAGVGSALVIGSLITAFVLCRARKRKSE